MNDLCPMCQEDLSCYLTDAYRFHDSLSFTENCPECGVRLDVFIVFDMEVVK